MPDIAEAPVDESPPEQATPPEPAAPRDQTASQPPPRDSVLPPWESVREELTTAYPAIPADHMQRVYEGVGHVVDWRARLQNAEERTGSWIYRRSLPVASAQLAFRNAGYVDAARQRIISGQGTPEDGEVMAVQARLAELDQNAGTGERILSGIARIPAVAGEAYLGGRLLRPIFGMFGGAAAAGAGAAETAGGVAGMIAGPGGEAAGSLLRPALTRAIQGAATAPLMPSLYTDRAIQNNREAGRNAQDWRGFPAAMTLAAIQNGVFSSVGNLGGSVPTGPGVLDTSRRLFAQTVGAMAVQQGMDIGTSGIDQISREVFGTSLNLDTHYGIIGSLARGSQGQALQDSIVEATTMFAFAAMHEAGNRPPARYDLRGRELPPARPPDRGVYPTPGGPEGPRGPVQWLRPQEGALTPTPRPPSATPFEFTDMFADLSPQQKSKLAGELSPGTRPPAHEATSPVVRGREATATFLDRLGGQGRSAPEAAAEMHRVTELVHNLVTTGIERGMTREEARQSIMNALPEGQTRDYGLRVVDLMPFVRGDRASSGATRFPLGQKLGQTDATGRLLAGPPERPPTFLGQNPTGGPQTLSPAATGEIFGQPGGPLHPGGEVVRQAIPGHADYPELPNPIAHAFADSLPVTRVTSRLDMPALVSPIAGGTEAIFNPKENSVHIDIGVNRQGVGASLASETVGMMRGLGKFLEAIKEQGTKVEYRAIDYKKAGGQTGSRAKVYAKMLERAGYEKVSESKGEFVWKPKQETSGVQIEQPDATATTSKAPVTTQTALDTLVATPGVTTVAPKPTQPLPKRAAVKGFEHPALKMVAQNLGISTAGGAVQLRKRIEKAPVGAKALVELPKIQQMLQQVAETDLIQGTTQIPAGLATGIAASKMDMPNKRALEGVLSGLSFDRIAALRDANGKPIVEKIGKPGEGVSHETARKYAEKAFDKLKAENPGKWDDYPKLKYLLLEKAGMRADAMSRQLGGEAISPSALSQAEAIEEALMSERKDAKEERDLYREEFEREGKNSGLTKSEIQGYGDRASEEELADRRRRRGFGAPASSQGAGGQTGRPSQGSQGGLQAQPAVSVAAQSAANITARREAAFDAAAAEDLASKRNALDFIREFHGDEFGHLDLDVVRDFVDQYGVQKAKAVYSHLDQLWRKLGGEMAPQVSDLNRTAGDSLARFMGAEDYARFMSPLLADKVLGGNTSPDFDLLLGATLTERRLRYMKKIFLDRANAASLELQAAISERQAADAGLRDAREQVAEHKKNKMPKAAEAAEAFVRTFTKAGNEAQAKAVEAANLSNAAIKAKNEVGTIIGRPDSPFKTIDDYKAAMQNRGISDAIKRHEKIAVPVMDDAFRRSKGMEPDDPINSFTQIPGSPVNLKQARGGDKDVSTVVWTREPSAEGGGGFGRQKGGRPTNAKLRKNKFSNQATGASEGYDIAYSKIIEHSMVHQLVNAAKAEAVRDGVEAGIYQWGKPGASFSFAGDEARWGVEFNDVKPPKGTQAALAGETSLYVHPDAQHEFRRSLEIDEPLKFKTISTLMDVLMTVNIASLAELEYHMKNQLTFLIRAGFHPVKMFHDIVGVIKKDPKIMDELVEIARLGLMKPPGLETSFINRGGNKNPLNWGSRILDLTRKVLLIQGKDAYERAAKAGLTNQSEHGLRDFLGQLGNYNSRSQHKLVKFLRDTKIGPFAVAGFNYLVQGVRSVTMNTGIKGRNLEGTLRLRAGMLLRTVGVLVVAELINKALWGRLDASDDTPLGAIRFGTSADGRSVYLDIMDLTGLKRGLRIMGLLALIEGKRKNAPQEKIVEKAAKDVITALVHPLAGPGAQFGLTAAFGVDSSGFHVAQHASSLKHEWQPALNVQAALEHANPAYAAIFAHTNRPKPLGERAMGLAGPFGLKTAPPPRLR